MTLLVRKAHHTPTVASGRIMVLGELTRYFLQTSTSYAYPVRCNDATWRDATNVGSVISSEFTTLLVGSVCSVCSRSRL